MKKTSHFIFFMGAVVILLTLVQVIVSNSLSTRGLTLGKLEEQTTVYKRHNAMMRERLLTIASYTRIASTAATLGFDQETKPVYYPSSLPIAVRF